MGYARVLCHRALETLIAKRAAFLVNRHQHRDPSKWWYGVYSDWDQIQKVLRGPGNRDGLAPWLVEASDDAGNARPAYVASKNLYFPDQQQIDSVELYIKHYLFAGNDWKTGVGGMQMTEQEPYPYGIYGTFDNWYEHRTIDPIRLRTLCLKMKAYRRMLVGSDCIASIYGASTTIPTSCCCTSGCTRSPRRIPV